MRKSQTILVLLFYSNAPAPECELAWDVGRRDSLVAVGPEPGNMISDVQYFLEMLNKPSVDVDRLKLGGVAALVPEVALPPRRPDRADVVCTRRVVIKCSKMWSSNVDHRVCTRNVEILASHPCGA